MAADARAIDTTCVPWSKAAGGRLLHAWKHLGSINHPSGTTYCDKRLTPSDGRVNFPTPQRCKACEATLAMIVQLQKNKDPS